ncbi:phosphoribosylglycinamide formyltransferase [Evansella sp. LMS18]|jgi:phosphoribosylglycinamide formyltransferase-1|uniref:phosphoribosylglycinamide formyltransferase n=1 Tax=Evansella sp. LMS18 TaxID=2924033 RepID=UPI0020D1A904|nr:phosphoribosylglycinamide formyltransferase [Evansella sp. LMS18]UTR08821.1 phosphoribosylglycinamide formyltransferase [Evansella sp. LMS18]
MNIAVFASGNGSNFEAIVQAGAEVKLLVCDKPGAYALERAESHGIQSFVFQPKDFSSKADYEQQIIEKLNECGIELIVLAGYMRLIGPVLLKAYEGRIINIHPSLLPAFPGLDAIGQAMDAGVKVSGVTVHFVDEGMDTGPIIAQEPVKIEDGDTLDDVTKKIQQVEHQLYPATVQRVIEDLKRGVQR